MKGFLIGLSFATKGFFQALAALLVIPFSQIKSSFPSCGMYYYIMNISVGVLALFVYVGMARDTSIVSEMKFVIYTAMQKNTTPIYSRNNIKYLCEVLRLHLNKLFIEIYRQVHYIL